MQTNLDDPITVATERYREARWRDAYHLLEAYLDESPDELGAARAKLALVAGYNLEDFKRGLQPGRDKHALLDEVEPVAEARGDLALLGHATFERGMALHIEFVMAEPDIEREIACFTRAAQLCEQAGDREAATMATAMMGVFHHVDLLDRETAEPILWEAYEMAPQPGPSLGKAEAARHLGQIKQELGDPAGGLVLLEESLRIRERAGWEVHLPSALHVVGYARLEAGDLDGARDALGRAHEIAERLDARLTLAFILRTEADLMMAELVPNVWRRSHP